MLRVVYTVLILASLGFGVHNLLRFKKQIWSNLSIRFFYIYGLLAMCFLIVQAWTDTTKVWYELVWLIPNTIVQACEICFAWC